MIKTGYIAFVTQTGGGFDPVTGFPIASTETVTDLIKCNLETVRREFRIMVDGEYTDAKYSIYLDENKVPETVDINTVEQIKVYDNNSNLLDTFRLDNIEFLKLSQRIKMVV